MSDILSREIYRRNDILPSELLSHHAFDEQTWAQITDIHSPAVVVVADATGIIGFAVLSNRPNALSTTVSEVWAVEHAINELLDAVVEFASTGSHISVKWLRPKLTHHAAAKAAGFAPLRAPATSGPGTEAGPGWIRYLREWTRDEAPYFRQTTDFTCGPASVLIAEGFFDDTRALTRSKEMRLWRRATNLRGCDPISLAAVIDPAVATPRVYLSTAEPVLLEGVIEPHERDLRTFLQEEAYSEVRSRGIDVERQLLDIDAIARAVHSGSVVLLLIDTLLLHGHKAPHWVVVHSVQDGIFLVDDPWVDPEEGESWLDGHDVPIAAEALDAMTWWGEPAYRGAIVLDPVR